MNNKKANVIFISSLVVATLALIILGILKSSYAYDVPNDWYTQFNYIEGCGELDQDCGNGIVLSSRKSPVPEEIYIPSIAKFFPVPGEEYDAIVHVSGNEFFKTGIAGAKKVTLEEGVRFAESDFYITNTSLEEINMPGFDVSVYANLFSAFYGNSKLKRLDLSNWKLGNINSFGEMFNSNINLEYINFSGWNTINITDMNTMFTNTGDLSNTDFSELDTDNVTNMSGMFVGTRTKSLDLSGWKTNNLLYMSNMFRGSDIENLNLSGWDTSNVVYYTDIFSNDTKLKKLNITGWKEENIFNRDNGLIFYRLTALNEITFSPETRLNDTGANWNGKWVNYDNKREIYDNLTDASNAGNGGTFVLLNNADELCSMNPNAVGCIDLTTDIKIKNQEGYYYELLDGDSIIELNDNRIQSKDGDIYSYAIPCGNGDITEKTYQLRKYSIINNKKSYIGSTNNVTVQIINNSCVSNPPTGSGYYDIVVPVTKHDIEISRSGDKNSSTNSKYELYTKNGQKVIDLDFKDNKTTVQLEAGEYIIKEIVDDKVVNETVLKVNNDGTIGDSNSNKITVKDKEENNDATDDNNKKSSNNEKVPKTIDRIMLYIGIFMILDIMGYLVYRKVKGIHYLKEM